MSKIFTTVALAALLLSGHALADDKGTGAVNTEVAASDEGSRINPRMVCLSASMFVEQTISASPTLLMQQSGSGTPIADNSFQPFGFESLNNCDKKL